MCQSRAAELPFDADLVLIHIWRLAIDLVGQHERALARVLVRGVDLRHDLDRLGDRIDEGQRHPQEVDRAELGEERGAERLDGEAGAVGDEEDTPALGHGLREEVMSLMRRNIVAERPI